VEPWVVRSERGGGGEVDLMEGGACGLVSCAVGTSVTFCVMQRCAQRNGTMRGVCVQQGGGREVEDMAEEAFFLFRFRCERLLGFAAHVLLQSERGSSNRVT
jgi:hypothetical protein